MKKFAIGLAAFVIAATVCIAARAEGEREVNNNRQTAQNMEKQSASMIPVPVVTHFNERTTISNWVKRWDRPNIPCYVYLFSYGNCIGYFISNGKPASTQSYLTPEYMEDTNGSWGVTNKQMPDVDGTYGNNNPGIRFFTATGSAVEAAGFQYIYSDTKLELNVPEIKFGK
jgi:hypothetical protein